MLTVPYVTTAEFTTYPTFLDLLNLQSGDSQLAHQTSVLNKVLLMSRAWCDNYLEMGAGATLTAHQHVASVGKDRELRRFGSRVVPADARGDRGERARQRDDPFGFVIDRAVGLKDAAPTPVNDFFAPDAPLGKQMPIGRRIRRDQRAGGAVDANE